MIHLQEKDADMIDFLTFLGVDFAVTKGEYLELHLAVAVPSEQAS
jgi:hypothetical protein